MLVLGWVFHLVALMLDSDLLYRLVSLDDSSLMMMMIPSFLTTLLLVVIVSTWMGSQPHGTTAEAFRSFIGRVRGGMKRPVETNNPKLLIEDTDNNKEEELRGDILRSDKDDVTGSNESSLNKSLTTTLQWWDDLAPPFGLYSSHEDDEDDEVGFMEDDQEQSFEYDESGGDTSDNNEQVEIEDGAASQRSKESTQRKSLRPMLNKPNYQADVVHFCFLLHGHRGLSRDLSYLQHRMERMAFLEKRRRRKLLQQRQSEQKEPQEDNDRNVTFTNHSITVGNDVLRVSNESFQSVDLTQDIVVHAAVCNEKKTTDGVTMGGERLVQEMLDVIREEMKNRRQDAEITVSVLGNSLGGIYGRYAVAKLAELCQFNGRDGEMYLDGKYRMHFNVFCTTASPHLGIASHTFLPLPRTAEIGVAHALGDTGRDLFRLNDVMKTMATSQQFLGPLRKFRKRIAYANAYGTDFPVPVHTAAFLSEDSEYPHHFYEDGTDEDRLVVDDSGLVVATLHTPPRDEIADEEDREELHLNQEDEDELVLMSKSLDSLGWKKVFVDVRKEVPKIGIPKVSQLLLGRNSNSSGNIETGSSESDDNITNIDSGEESLDRLKEKGVVGSKDVAAAVSKPSFGEQEFHWPMGHNMIIAFSRSRLSTYLNKAGRPVVDSLARELVKDIFSWPDNRDYATASRADKNSIPPVLDNSMKESDTE